jgi:archaeal flagellar protein FlaI
MRFDKTTSLYSYEVKKEGGEDVMYVNYMGAPYVPVLAEFPEVMERTIDLLTESSNVSRLVLVQEKSYNYDAKETFYLLEVAQLYSYFTKQEKILSHSKLVTNAEEFFAQRYNSLFSFLYTLKQDPILAYYELRKILMEEKILLDKIDLAYRTDQGNYVRFLEKIFLMVEELRLIVEAKKFMKEFSRGDRRIYHRIFKPDAIPNFTFSRLVADLPDDSEIVDQYTISGEYEESMVTILRKKNEAKLIYHLNPVENSLPENQTILLNLARGVLIEHQPKSDEFTDTERTRQVFFNIAKDLLRDLAESKGFALSYEDVNKLATILVRHTVGFGLIEVLLQDENLQDIVLNAPIPQTLIFLRHQEHEECVTNIMPSQEDVLSWSAKFRMISGRPLDEANPILDTQMAIGNLRARVAIIQRPLSPNGLSYAIRRHRENPWTLPLFIENKMINPLSAGLMSFLIDGSRTMLIAGTRSSGKSSLLGSLMLEIIPKHRVIVIEDSLELPIDALRRLNYDILSMKVRSALLKTTTEVSADDGIRTSLRLGDSALIVGEVRSVEAKALYEAMRVGALANVVAGTIHGASPYGVFDRVVNDLGVPATSFKATDIIAIANPIKTPDGLHSYRRMLSVSEVRKHWTKDPMEEKGFVDLLKYDVGKDELLATADLINGDSEVIKDIASNVKGWAGNWDAVYDNILLRAKIKKEMVEVSKKVGDKNLLEAEFNTRSNHEFHKISDKIGTEIGVPMMDRVFPEWQRWLNGEIKKRN